MDDRATSSALLSPGEELSTQEQEVIDEYVRLADNMKKVRAGPPTTTHPPSSGPNVFSDHQRVFQKADLLCAASKQLASILDTMAAQPTTEILDGLRDLERKTALVFTLLKTSVYSIVLQQELDWGDQAQQ